jgi:hypothetical protein
MTSTPSYVDNEERIIALELMGYKLEILRVCSVLLVCLVSLVCFIQIDSMEQIDQIDWS